MAHHSSYILHFVVILMVWVGCRGCKIDDKLLVVVVVVVITTGIIIKSDRVIEKFNGKSI